MIEITWRKIFTLFLVGVPVVLLLSIVYGLLQAYYGPVNVIIEAAFDKSAYSPGESVRVNIRVSSEVLGSLIKLPAAGVGVGIEVRNGEGGLVFVNQADTDSAGETEFVFRVPYGALRDVYTIYLASPGNSISAKIAVEG